MIYIVKGFSKVDKHPCRNASFINAFPNTICEICNHVLGRVIFPEHRTGREIVDLTYLNDGGAVFAQFIQGFLKPPINWRWDVSYPYNFYPHLYIGGLYSTCQCDFYSPKAVGTLVHRKCYQYCFLHCG